MTKPTAPKAQIPPPAERLGEIGLNNFIPYLMNRIMGRYNTALRSEMAKLDLTTPKMRALSVLAVMDGLQISQLCVYSVVEQSTMSRALEQLERAGLVRRDDDPVDSRAQVVWITDEGRAVFDLLWPHMAAAYERMLHGIEAEERQAFVGTLQKILTNVRQHEY